MQARPTQLTGLQAHARGNAADQYLTLRTSYLLLQHANGRARDLDDYSGSLAISTVPRLSSRLHT